MSTNAFQRSETAPLIHFAATLPTGAAIHLSKRGHYFDRSSLSVAAIQCQLMRFSVVKRPHLSISQPHFPQVPPAQSACVSDLGRRSRGIAAPQVGQFTGFVSIPHRFLVTVPNATNRLPKKRIEVMTTKTTFIT